MPTHKRSLLTGDWSTIMAPDTARVPGMAYMGVTSLALASAINRFRQVTVPIDSGGLTRKRACYLVSKE